MPDEGTLFALQVLLEDEAALIAADGELQKAKLAVERQTKRVEALKVLIEVLEANPVPVDLKDVPPEKRC